MRTCKRNIKAATEGEMQIRFLFGFFVLNVRKCEAEGPNVFAFAKEEPSAKCNFSLIYGLEMQLKWIAIER